MLVRLSHVKLQTILSRTSSFTHVSPLISRNRLQNVAKFIQPNPLIGKRLVNRSFSTTTEESDLEDKNKGKKSKKSEVEEPQIEDIYQKKTPIEHVLLRPDTYIGTTQATTEHYWVVEKSESGVQIVKREITFVPGLYKIFDEILVNASDNRQRDPVNMNEIQVEINPKKGKISIWNNGKGIPIQLHKKEGLYIPELVLGQLLTGSNFNDSIAKVTGGRNGYGAKLTNIFSTEFEVETVDIKQGLKYKQKWTNNMGNKTEPLITPVHLSGKKPSTPESEEVTGDYTKVSFKPDLSKFGMSTLEEGDILKLMERRVYDVAGCNNRVTVTLNGNKLPNTFEEYLSLYVDPDIEFDDSVNNNNNNNDSKRYFSRINERWQVGVGISHSGHFSQVSFVNSICTSKGGTHVNYIADQVVKYIIDQLKSQNKDMKLNPNHIKHHLDVYVNCLVENPSFDSQTKETLTTKISNFGSTCHLSKSFLQEFINRTNILEHITNWAKAKEQNELITHTRSRSVVGIPKLYDANWAGTEKGNECTLILTEGDSAKALAVSGLSSLGRDKYGVFPLKGKLLNVRDATAKQLMENAEINHLVTILGLNYDKQYDSPEQKSELRYGKVMLMTDQDHDGSHIKGLFINFINTFWPSLLVNGNFLEEFITPIVKASKGKNKLTFFTIPEYEQWKQSLTPEESKGYTIKYYKGLGTNTSAEAKEYFGNLEKHRIEFAWNPESQESIELAFKKDQTEERKTWLSNFKEGTHVDHSIKKLTIQDFIHKELILFSRADNIRSIPNVIDGLKPGQRKVLFACFKRNLKNEIKVAQLAGYVSEQTAYHHGEVSLHSTIINMAQDFVGSNNLPILFPSGQFGSRLQGGKDAASARYLFTRLQSYTRKLFPEVDDDLLNYLDDDGQQIQPEKYVPIIPTILINGCEGLGTGWSTKVPMYNPIEIIDNLINKIEGKEMKDLFPFARGFQGTIEKKGENGFITRGILQEIDNTTLVIKELPLNTWIDPYKEYLDELVRPPHGAKPIIKNYTMQHTDGSVKFVIKLTKPMMERLKLIGPIKKLKLESLLNTSNMILFDANNNIKKYHSPLEIIDDFYAVRLEFYEKRKSYLTEKLQKETEKLQNRARFCTLVANGEIKVGNRSKQDLLTELENLNFTKKFEPTANDYDYLLSTALWNLTHERIQVLLNEKAKKEIELEALKKTTALDIWKTELTDLRNDLVHDFPAFLKHQYHHL